MMSSVLRSMFGASNSFSAPTQVQQQQQQMPTSSSRSRRQGSRQCEAPSDIVPPLTNKTRPLNYDHTVISMVVDRSGSMQSMGAEVYGGCNAYLEECLSGDREDNTQSTVIFTRFDNVSECIYDSVPLTSELKISAEDVRPRGGTALYDAIGSTMQKTAHMLEKLDHVPKVVFFILTDGHENASQQWNKTLVTKQIKKLQESPYNWDFYFAAANQDAMNEGHAIGMDMSSCISYSATPMGMSNAFKSQAKAQIRRKKGGSKGFTMTERRQAMEEE